MKQLSPGSSGLSVPAIAAGCMRWNTLEPSAVNRLIHTALDCGICMFDHADIYGGGRSEEVFSEALRGDSSVSRDQIILQSKCGIRNGWYDSSKEHILSSVDGILRRLQTDYLDILLLHRPDALMEPEEVAEAFDTLFQSGKVRHFGVSNYRPSQIALLRSCVKQPLVFDQMQFSLPMAGIISYGMEANMQTPGAADRDGGILDFCRLNGLTIQAWSPFQGASGPFTGSPEYPELNEALQNLADRYQSTPTAIAATWILRHPAGIQIIAGTTRPERLREIAGAAEITLTRQEWYQLYRAAGHPIP